MQWMLGTSPSAFSKGNRPFKITLRDIKLTHRFNRFVTNTKGLIRDLPDEISRRLSVVLATGSGDELDSWTCIGLETSCFRLE